jgi:hypothetical protein
VSLHGYCSACRKVFEVVSITQPHNIGFEYGSFSSSGFLSRHGSTIRTLIIASVPHCSIHRIPAQRERGEISRRATYCNHLATGPVQNGTRWTCGRTLFCKNAANQHNYRTRWYGLEHARSNSGSVSEGSNPSPAAPPKSHFTGLFCFPLSSQPP